MKAVGNVHEYLDLANRAVMSEAWRIFCKSRYKVCRTLGVSRYRTVKVIVNYPGLPSCLQIVACPGIKAVEIYPGAGATAKNVTSLFTLLSVLSATFIFFYPTFAVQFTIGLIK